MQRCWKGEILPKLIDLRSYRSEFSNVTNNGRGAQMVLLFVQMALLEALREIPRRWLQPRWPDLGLGQNIKPKSVMRKHVAVFICILDRLLETSSQAMPGNPM